MTDIASIISQLEHQRAAIDKALTALREAGGESPVKRRGRPPGSATKKRRGMSTEGRQRQIAAMRAYWAAKKAGTRKGAAKKATK